MSFFDILLVSFFNLVLDFMHVLLIKFHSVNEFCSHSLHFIHSSIGFRFRNKFSVSIHVFLETHESQQHANHGTLSHDTRLHHFELKGNVFLTALAIENVGNGGNSKTSKNFKGILLPVVCKLVMRSQRVPWNDSDSGLFDRLTIEFRELLIRRKIGSRLGAMNVLAIDRIASHFSVVFILLRHFVHAVNEFILRRVSKGKECWHDYQGSTTLPVCSSDKVWVSHCQCKSSTSRNQGNDTTDEALLHGNP
mmetsp:Transcript_21053/g.38228  ORF Transcript_21053/g.38228 Transcript_21053/m.38228 type:complete len:250 (-) Transcript_21053:135-884(-)